MAVHLPTEKNKLTPSSSKELLNKWLRVYTNETHNKSGKPYPSNIIQSLLSGPEVFVSYEETRLRLDALIVVTVVFHHLYFIFYF